MAGKSVHIDGKKFPRKGWFAKQEDGQPIPDYRGSCKDGYKGGVKWDAHHVIPQTAIVQSIDEQPAAKRKYITTVQLITDWNINKSTNLRGMPQFISYLYYYRKQDGLVTNQDLKLKALQELAKVKGYINTFNNSKKALLRLYAGIKKSPEHNPIHRPVSWGHTVYNVNVKSDLSSQVWSKVHEQKKAHKADAKTVQTVISDVARKWKRFLRTRGIGANRQKWNCRNNKSNNTWYKPFTMADLGKSPLF
jgi:hypothetical protein